MISLQSWTSNQLFLKLNGSSVTTNCRFSPTIGSDLSFSLHESEVYSIDSSKMMDSFPEVLHCKHLLINLNWFICKVAVGSLPFIEWIAHDASGVHNLGRSFHKEKHLPGRLKSLVFDRWGEGGSLYLLILGWDLQCQRAAWLKCNINHIFIIWFMMAAWMSRVEAPPLRHCDCWEWIRYTWQMSGLQVFSRKCVRSGQRFRIATAGHHLGLGRSILIIRSSSDFQELSYDLTSPILGRKLE